MEDLIRPYVASLSERRATLYSKLLGMLPLGTLEEWEAQLPLQPQGVVLGSTVLTDLLLLTLTLHLSSALAYGLLCLCMAYISSMMGPMLQVRDSAE